MNQSQSFQRLTVVTAPLAALLAFGQKGVSLATGIGPSSTIIVLKTVFETDRFMSPTVDRLCHNRAEPRVKCSGM